MTSATFSDGNVALEECTSSGVASAAPFGLVGADGAMTGAEAAAAAGFICAGICLV